MNRAVAQYNAVNATQVNDRTRRFGYSGGVPNLLMDAKKSGLDCNPIEGGRLLLFLQGKDGFIQAGHDGNGNIRKAYHTNYPIDYLNNVGRAFHLTNDMGFRPLEMLTKLPYETPPAPPVKAPTSAEATNNPFSVIQYEEKIKGYNETYNEQWIRDHDEAYAYFDVVHPALNECSFGLNKPVQLTDPGVGASTLVMQVCPTCRLADLRSEACEQRIYEASQHLDSEVLMQLRTALIAACEAAVLHASNKLEEVESEIQGRRSGEMAGRTRYNVIDRILMKMLHREERKETNVVEQLAGALANAAGVNQQKVAPTIPDGAKVLSPEEAAAFEAWQASQSVKSPGTVGDGGFVAGMAVLCEGERGVITEVKTAGWYLVTLENGETKTVRKDKLEVV